MQDMFNLAVVLSAVDRATGPIRQVQQSLGGLGEQAERVRRVGEQMTVAGALSQGAASQMSGALGQVVRPAIEFESQMADVRKVVDFSTPEQFAELGADIRQLSTEIPVAAGGLAEIVAAAGQSGVARDNLTAFAEDAAKMATAFDMTAGEAGQAMASIRAGLGLTQQEMVALGDVTNHLSNNLNAAAGEVTQVIQRQGAVAASAGLAAEETAALSAALLNSGQSPEIAATALKNLVGSLTAGEAATSKQSQALEQLGFSAQNMAQFMQNDAQAAIQQVFQALAQQPAEKQGALAKMIFGEESKGAIMPLLTNMEELDKAFRLAGDQSRYAGSMQAEYETRSETTANALQLFTNQLEDLRITLGSFVLPAMNDMLPVLQGIVEGIKEFAEAHPGLFRIALGFAGILAAVLAVVAPIMTVAGGLTLMGSYGLQGVGLVVGALRTLGPLLLSTVQYTRTFATSFLGFAARSAPAAIASLARLGMSLGATLIPALGTATTVAWGFAAALLANPITWVVAAVVAAAGLIYAFWGPISDFFKGLWSDIRAGFESGFLEGVVAVLQALNPVSWVADGLNALVRYLFGVDLAAAGRSMLASLWSGLASAWSGVTGFFQARWDAVVAGFDEGLIQGLAALARQMNPLHWIAQALDIDLSASGRKLLMTVVDGIQSVAMAPVNAVKDALGAVRELLPFSDAKKGPLSDLTGSGQRLLQTLGEGVAAQGATPLARPLSAAMSAAMAGVSPAALGAPAVTAPEPSAPEPPAAIQEVRPQVQAPTLPAIPDAVQRVRPAVEPPPMPAVPDAVQRIRRLADPLPGLSAPEPPVTPAPRIAPLPQPAAAPGAAGAAGAGGEPVSVTVNVSIDAGAAAEGEGDLADRLDGLLRERGREIADLVAEQTRRRGRRSYEDDR